MSVNSLQDKYKYQIAKQKYLSIQDLLIKHTLR